MTEENQNWTIVFYNKRKPISSSFISTDKETVAEISSWLVNNSQKIPIFGFDFDEIGYIKCFDFVIIGNIMLEEMRKELDDENS
jgi:hypothetical protein